MNDINSSYYSRVYDYFCGARIKEDDLLNPQISIDDGRQKKTVHLPRHTPEKIEYAKLARKIDQLLDKGQRHHLIENIIVHGSYGDYSANNYSDIDLTIMFNDNIFYNKTLLLQARKFVLRDVIPFSLQIDPFQHHGPFILWPGLLKHYEESILPTAVYQHAWAAVKTEYTFCVSHAVSDDYKLNLTCEKVFSLGKMSVKTNDLYLTKRFLSNLMLIPAFFQLAQGKPCHKAPAFKHFQAAMGSFEALSYASAIRSNWPILTFYRILGRLLTPLLLHKTLLTGVCLGRISRLIPHRFCIEHLKKCNTGLDSICSAITRKMKNG